MDLFYMFNKVFCFEFLSNLVKAEFLKLFRFIINKITRSLNIFERKTNDAIIISLYYIFGLDFPEAIIKVRDFFIHTIS